MYEILSSMVKRGLEDMRKAEIEVEEKEKARGKDEL